MSDVLVGGLSAGVRFEATRLVLAADLSIAEWADIGRKLGRIDRAVQWWIGDWWAFGEHAYGERVDLVRADDWTGPSYQTCRNAASVCRAFTMSRRRDILPFTHHAEVAALAPEVQDRLLDAAQGIATETGTPPPSRQLREIAKRERRAEREEELAEATERASQAIGSRLYSVIYADPPWQLEPWSRETGLNRAADNHYPTMPTIDICNLVVPAAKHAVLFLWRTAPMAKDGHQVMDAWGFEYRTEFVWVKPRMGTGYWNRNRHEVLMVGVRGRVPAPAPGQQWDSVIEAELGAHSAKPSVFREMIDQLYPSQRGLEMFARETGFDGWDAWGNQA